MVGSKESPPSEVSRFTSLKFGGTNADSERGVYPSENSRRWPILERPHERIIFAFFGLSSTAALWFAARFSSESTSMAILAETGVALTWASMILAISFVEAWVKFRAPFLRRRVAVDVGRHVFAALNAAELGLCGSFWAGRAMQRRSQLRSGTMNACWNEYEYYLEPGFALPAIASLTLVAQVVCISPRLFLRAKARIVKGFEKQTLSVKEKRVFDELSQEVEGAPALPSSRWHGVYALLELVKVGCLHLLVLVRWIQLVE